MIKNTNNKLTPLFSTSIISIQLISAEHVCKRSHLHLQWSSARITEPEDI